MLKFLLDLLVMLFGELVKQFPDFITKAFTEDEKVEVKSGPLDSSSDPGLLSNDDIDVLLR